jgi:predicted site-specific integrase-resolvase
MLIIDNLKMYDSEELCELFNVNKSTLQRYRKEGKIISVAVGRKKYTSEKEIKRFLRGYNKK